MKHRERGIALALSAAILAVIACGGTSSAPTNTPVPTVPPPTPTPPAEPVGVCDSTDQELELNRAYQLSVPASSSYPGSCHLYCVRVPDDGRTMTFSLTGFDVDLDIYVDRNLSVLAFEDHGQWESNAYGNGDEFISLSSPQGGPYYMQICSYEGLASPFTLQVDWSR